MRERTPGLRFHLELAKKRATMAVMWPKTKIAFALCALWLVACGYPPPQEVRPGVYKLQFCQNESKCFEAAEKTCPGGYHVTSYGSLRPEEFTCQ